MKKILLGTTALVLAGAFASTAASSTDWNVRVGGDMEQDVAYATSETDDDDVIAQEGNGGPDSEGGDGAESNGDDAADSPDSDDADFSPSNGDDDDSPSPDIIN